MVLVPPPHWSVPHQGCCRGHRGQLRGSRPCVSYLVHTLHHPPLTALTTLSLPSHHRNPYHTCYPHHTLTTFTLLPSHPHYPHTITTCNLTSSLPSHHHNPYHTCYPHHILTTVTLSLLPSHHHYPHHHCPHTIPTLTPSQPSHCHNPHTSHHHYLHITHNWMSTLD